MAPSTPGTVTMAVRSSRLLTPPLATTGRSVAAVTERSRSRLGPVRVPSRRTSVTTYREHPSASRRASTSNSSPPSEGPPRAARRGPPARGERRAAPAGPGGDPVADPGDGGADPVGVLQGGGADVDPGGAGGERGLEGGVVADPAGQLDLNVELADHLREQLAVGTPAEGGVEV